ncbi:transposase [Paeniroseomonas aquatica]|uniref:Transposase n=1 Tax=Paeniroseomonas aquatica TaxID=373043 RepID=A0ABT8A0V5_9PROT|nr:transposase [Paeniroseomonas aquatica]MDN3563364.1 transposase [Paeniroseomonas aquatica]
MEIEAEATSAYTRRRMSARSEVVEVVTRGERRRAWWVEQKLAIVAEAMRPGATPAEVARRWGIGTGLLYTRRQQFFADELGEPPVPAPAFVQVSLARPVESEAAPHVRLRSKPTRRRKLARGRSSCRAARS